MKHRAFRGRMDRLSVERLARAAGLPSGLAERVARGLEDAQAVEPEGNQGIAEFAFGAEIERRGFWVGCHRAEQFEVANPRLSAAGCESDDRVLVDSEELFPADFRGLPDTERTDGALMTVEQLPVRRRIEEIDRGLGHGRTPDAIDRAAAEQGEAPQFGHRGKGPGGMAANGPGGTEHDNRELSGHSPI